MKILIVTPSYKPAYCYGGPTISVSELAEALVSTGHSVTVFTTTANGKAELDVPRGTAVNVNGVIVYYFKRMTGDHTHIAPRLWKKLWKTCNGFDIVHLQSWWSLLIQGAAFVCKLKQKKFVLSPRGMLSAYSFKNSHSLLKKILHMLFTKRLLKGSILHATSLLEWRDCTQVYNNWQGFIVHNLINLPEFDSPVGKQKKNDVFTVGFLSRIDPKKGIELLFEALSKVCFDFRLRVAGNGDEEYVTSLKSLASKLAISSKIEWCGWMNGNDKFIFFQSIDLFALTSYNENFGIAVTESLAIGTAVLISENVGLADYVIEKDLGWVCQTKINSIAERLTYIYNNQDELKRIKKHAVTMIKEDFDKRNLANQYAGAYRNAIDKSISY